MAKIVIAISADQGLDSPIDSRFGRCPYFLIYDTGSGDYRVVPNQSTQVFRGAGIAAAQFVASQKATAVIAGSFGPNAFGVLNQAGIKLYSFSGSAKQAIDAYKEGNLAPLSQAGGLGRGRGRGSGFGRGRGGWTNFPNL